MMLNFQHCLSHWYAEIMNKHTESYDDGHISIVLKQCKCLDIHTFNESTTKLEGMAMHLCLILISLARSSPNPKYPQLNSCDHTTFVKRCDGKDHTALFEGND
jgi:hypothetical protein